MRRSYVDPPRGAVCETAGMTSAAGPLLVLDTASLYYRSFYAMPSSMRAPDGRPNGAVRGFLSTLARLIEMYSPSAILAAWDEDWRPAWRVDLMPSYKTHRLADPQDADPAGTDPAGEDEPVELGPQVEAIADLLDAWGLPRWGLTGYEADDVAASVSSQSHLWPAGASGCVIVSGDRDLVQLIGTDVELLLTVNGGMEKWPLLTPNAATERFGISPDQYVDMAVLRGDASDGLPGVPGVGPKTAVNLISTFGTLEAVLTAADQTPVPKPLTPRIADRIRTSTDELTRARTVTTAVRDLALPGPVPLLPSQPRNADALVSIAARWGVERQLRDLVPSLV